MSVVLTGPFSPSDASTLLSGQDRAAAASLQGYRGVPTQSVVAALLAEGVAVEVVTEAEEIEEPVEFQGDRLRILVAPSRSRARERALDLFREERRALTRLLARTEGNVINAQWTYEFAWAALADRRPTLVTAQDAPLTILAHYRDAYRASRALMAYIVRSRVRHLAAVSPYLAAKWRREMLYRGPIPVLPNIAPAEVLNGPRARPSAGNELVGVSDAGARKNNGALLEAFALLRRSHPDARLNLVGPGLEASGRLAAEARTRGLADGVEFHGSVDRPALRSVFERSSVFVHPSLEESFGMVLVEAIAAGLPVVAGARSGGVPWVLGEGEAGLLVDVRRPAEIAGAVATLLDDDERARLLVERARSYAAQMFAPPVVAQMYLEELARISPHHARSRS